jgi:phospholipase/carboxylesterase
MQENQFLDYPEIASLTPTPEKLVVLLHGLGSDGNDLINLVPYIQKAMPACHFISPHGIEAYDMAPFGRQWFSLQDRSASVVLKLAEKNAPLINELIKHKQKELNITNKNTILIGFSQGAMIAMYLTLTQMESYGATIAFSGRLLPLTNLINRLTPICLIHGKDDDVVNYEETNNAAKYFTKNEIKHEKLLIDNLTHSIDDKGLKFALQFLKNYKMI